MGMLQKHGKDCLQTVLSEGLNIDYDLIPRFYENDDTWQERYNLWLHQMGLFRVLVDVEYTETMKFPYCSEAPVLLIGILHKKPRKHDHAVILELTENEVIMHDPKPKSDYDLTDLVQVEIIFRGSE